MKANDYILIYDDKCPLCAAYTSWFVKCGILSADGRKNFSTVNENVLQKLDVIRSTNEIPLIDTAANKVYYGIDALLELLGSKVGVIKAIGKFGPVHWLLKKLYRFISYNRKVITATTCNKGQFDCSPEFNSLWRFLFLLVFLTINTIGLLPITNIVFANSIFSGASLVNVQAIHFMLVTINILLACTLGKRRAFEYLGQVNMLATITVLVLLALTVVNKFVFSNAAVNNTVLALLTLLVAYEYRRRMTYAGTLKKLYVTVTNIMCISGMLLFLYVAR